MCVIAVKKKGIDMIDDETIEDMWFTNSDGAGFMYTLNKRVYIEKGFMEIKSLKNALLGFKEKVEKNGKDVKDIPLIMHFRITTHGGTNPENTHPYPISKKSEFLRALDCYTEMAVAHNGIIRSIDNNSSESDTAAYIRKVLVPLFNMNKEFTKDDNIKSVIENTINGSRLAFLDLHGDVSLIGDFQEENGVFYSNLLHKISSFRSLGSRVYKSGSGYFEDADDGYWESYANGGTGGYSKPQKTLIADEIMEEIYFNEHGIEEDWWAFVYSVTKPNFNSVPNSEAVIYRGESLKNIIEKKQLRELPEGICLAELGGVNYEFTRIVPTGFKSSYVIKEEDVGNYFVDRRGDVYLRFVNNENMNDVKVGQEVFFSSCSFDYALASPVDKSLKAKKSHDFMLMASSEILEDFPLIERNVYMR